MPTTGLIGLAGYWGQKKISIKNIIVFINNKPLEEFQGVKILSLADTTGVSTPEKIQTILPVLIDKQINKLK